MKGARAWRRRAFPVRMAIFDDTCGNLIQLVEFPKAA